MSLQAQGCEWPRDLGGTSESRCHGDLVSLVAEEDLRVILRFLAWADVWDGGDTGGRLD